MYIWEDTSSLIRGAGTAASICADITTVAASEREREREASGTSSSGQTTYDVIDRVGAYKPIPAVDKAAAPPLPRATPPSTPDPSAAYSRTITPPTRTITTSKPSEYLYLAIKR